MPYGHHSHKRHTRVGASPNLYGGFGSLDRTHKLYIAHLPLANWDNPRCRMSKLKQQPAAVPLRAESSGKRQVVWTLIASAVAGLSTYYYSLTKGPTAMVSLPNTYALCANGSRIYTADESTPQVDCIVVDKQTIATTGTLGGGSITRSPRYSLTPPSQRRFSPIGTTTRTI